MVFLLLPASHATVAAAFGCGRCFDVGQASKVSETGETRHVVGKASRELDTCNGDTLDLA
jgi:hypothetical protein